MPRCCTQPRDVRRPAADESHLCRMSQPARRRSVQLFGVPQLSYAAEGNCCCRMVAAGALQQRPCCKHCLSGTCVALDCAGRAQRRRRFGSLPDGCSNADLIRSTPAESKAAWRLASLASRRAPKTLVSPFAGHFVIVVKLQLVYLEAVDC